MYWLNKPKFNGKTTTTYYDGSVKCYEGYCHVNQKSSVAELKRNGWKEVEMKDVPPFVLGNFGFNDNSNKDTKINDNIIPVPIDTQKLANPSENIIYEINPTVETKIEEENNKPIELTPLDKKEKLVSIITTTFDRDYCLVNLVKSINELKYKNIEFVLVGDGGKNMSEILSQSGIENYRYIHVSKNIGLYKAQILGMRACTGDYICTIDDDDTYYPDAIDIMLYEFEKYDVDVVFARCNRTFVVKNKETKEVYPRDNLNEISTKRMLSDNFNHASARMFGRKCFDKIGYPNEKIEILGDWDYGIMLANNCKYKFINDIVSNVVIKESGMTHSMKNNKKWHTEAQNIKDQGGKLRKPIINPTLSLLIPLYKTTTWSKVAVWSAISCTLKYTNEIILINDGSPEDEYENIKDFVLNYPNIRYHETKDNRGISAALNLGLQYCNGEYVGFIGGDDELYSGHYDYLIDALKNSSNKVLAYGNGHILQPHGLECSKQKEYNRKDLMSNNYIAKFMVWKRSLHERVGKFREDFKVALDWDMWIKLSFYGDFIHVPTMMGAWRNRIGCANKDYYKDCTIEIGEMMKQYGSNYIVNENHTVRWV